MERPLVVSPVRLLKLSDMIKMILDDACVLVDPLKRIYMSVEDTANLNQLQQN